MGTLSRRQFLAAGAGAAVLAACGTSGDDAGTVKVKSPDGSVQEPGARLNLVVATYVHVAGLENQRLTLSLLNDDADGPLKPEGDVRITIDGAEVPAELHAEGVALPYLLVHHRFAQAGVVTARASSGGRTGEAAVQILDPAAVTVPFPGRPMIVTPSPTVADHRGVDPVCTRDPACPLHDVSLDAALAEKKPLAVLFATPARCQSRLCGPVLDTLLAQRDAFADRVRFLHVEIYEALTGTELAPVVKAYHLEQEPILFLAGADGVVRDRLDNIYDAGELRAGLQALVA